MKTLPKSLHTVTAWANVARHLAAQNGLSPNNAAHAAAHVLGLEEMSDTYALREAVIKQLEKVKQWTRPNVIYRLRAMCGGLSYKRCHYVPTPQNKKQSNARRLSA